MMWVKEILIIVEKPGEGVLRVHTVFDATKHKSLDGFLKQVRNMASVTHPEKANWILQTKSGKTMINKLDVAKTDDNEFLLFTLPNDPNFMLPKPDAPKKPNRENATIALSTTPKLPRISNNTSLVRALSEPNLLNDPSLSPNSEDKERKIIENAYRTRIHTSSTGPSRQSKAIRFLEKSESTTNSQSVVHIPGWKLDTKTDKEHKPLKRLRRSRSADLSDEQPDSGIHSASEDSQKHGQQRSSDTNHKNYARLLEHRKQNHPVRTRPPLSPGKEREQKNEGLVQKSKWIMPIENKDYVTTKYKFEGVIGDGNFAVVHKCMSVKNNRYWAIKEITKSNVIGKEHYIENEVDILCRCRHPNIIKLAEAYQTPTEYYMVLELLEYGDLFDAIKSHSYFPEQLAADVVKDVANALHYLHQYDIVHRDIKPENLLLTSAFHVKLADFGLACKVLGPLFRVCGTPTYVAPEVLAETTGYGVAVDMWALGVITYIMLCGYAPFRNKNKEKLFTLIQEAEFSFQTPGWNTVSRGAKKFIASLLTKEPDNRITAAEVLRNKWLQSLTARESREKDI